VRLRRSLGAGKHKKLHAFLAGVAAGVVGLIAMTLLDLGRAGVERSPNLLVTLVIFVTALAILYDWKSKLATPVVLAIGAAVGVAWLA
jgi:chromate transporter